MCDWEHLEEGGTPGRSQQRRPLLALKKPQHVVCACMSLFLSSSTSHPTHHPPKRKQRPIIVHSPPHTTDSEQAKAEGARRGHDDGPASSRLPPPSSWSEPKTQRRTFLSRPPFHSPTHPPLHPPTHIHTGHSRSLLRGRERRVGLGVISDNGRTHNKLKLGHTRHAHDDHRQVTHTQATATFCIYSCSVKQQQQQQQQRL